LIFYLIHIFTFLLNRHVSKQDKVDKLYRQGNQASVFSLDSDEEGDSKRIISSFYLFFDSLEPTSSSKQRDAPELVDIESWFLRSDMLYKYECEHIDETNRRHPR
jgi:hypothetical protein